MEIAEVTILIAQTAAAVILIFALVSYIVYKVKSKYTIPQNLQTSNPRIVEHYSPKWEVSFEESAVDESQPQHAAVFARIQTHAVRQRVTSNDLYTEMPKNVRYSRPEVVNRTSDQPKNRMQMAQNRALFL